ncbi:40290_t:CDS:2, partial [Gigaspora margarita]
MGKRLANIEIRNLLNAKDLEKGTQALRKLNLWYLEQIITRQDNIMLTWQQIKRVHGIEMKGKMPQCIKEVFIQVDKINETQIKPGKRKLLHKRSKKEWVIGKKENSIRPFLGKMEKILDKKMHILEWEETDKENLSHNSPLRSSIVPTSKILKVKKNEVEDVSSWIKQKNEGAWAMTISLKHLKNLIAPEKNPFERKESKIEHVVLMENWD